MTKAAALYQFFNQFLPSFTTTSVPDDVEFPYLTYELVTGAWGDGENAITVNLWFYTESEATPNAMADKLSKAIGLGGVMLPCDGGSIWLKRGSPWCQSLKDEVSVNIKRRYINISADYMTAY